MKTYSIVEIFPTLQGEGYWAGTPFVFCRFAGCNLWSGNDEHRERDADRHGARCPMFCDTDFRPVERLTADELVARIREATKEIGNYNRVVFTGGEPLLQLDREITIQLPEFYIAVETNGTVAIADGVRLNWVCVSPKVPADRLKLRRGDEIKVVFPDYDPREYETAGTFRHYWIQPAAAVGPGVGKSVIAYDIVQRAAELCRRMPGWRLSLQTHKIIGVP